MKSERLGSYLFKRIKDYGVDVTFGIPGDYAMPIYAAQEQAGLKTVVMTHEPAIGFAADAYARLKGLGVAIVTYGAGTLNIVNAVATAWAEESPLLVISGSPERKFRSQPPLLHHCVKEFDTPFKVLREVTESQALLLNPAIAQEEIERVLATTIKTSRPGYIELPRDMVNIEIPIADRAPASRQGASQSLNDAVLEIASHLQSAKNPVLFVGAQTSRFHLTDKVVELSELLNIPVATSILGKSSFPESHKNFIGNYFGQFGNPAVREYVESADLIVAIGAILTEMETGGFTAKLPADKLVQCLAGEIKIGHHIYQGMDLKLTVEAIVSRMEGTSRHLRFAVPQIAQEDIALNDASQALTVSGIIDTINNISSAKYSIVCDEGDCLYAGMSIKTDVFIAPGYYATMGSAVPSAIGAQLADLTRRPIVLVGDGGFQMTGMEIATAVKTGLNPIVIVFNNASYAMLRFIDREREIYNIPSWDYAALAKAVGADGIKAQTGDQFEKAIGMAEKSDKPFLIEAIISKTDISPTLKRLTDYFGAKVRATISA